MIREIERNPMAHPVRIAKDLLGGEDLGRRFVATLIRRGILQWNRERKSHEVPIPSMRQWLLEDFARSIGLGVDEVSKKPKPYPNPGS